MAIKPVRRGDIQTAESVIVAGIAGYAAEFGAVCCSDLAAGHRCVPAGGIIFRSIQRSAVSFEETTYVHNDESRCFSNSFMNLPSQAFEFSREQLVKYAAGWDLISGSAVVKVDR